MRQHARQCDGKPGHSTPEKARAAIIRDHKGMAEFYSAYFCPFCRLWHTGHKKGGRAREAKLAKYNRALDEPKYKGPVE